MKKIFIVFTTISINAFCQSNFIEDFAINPISNGWTYYNNGSVNNFTTPGQYLNISTNAYGTEGMQTAFYRKQLDFPLSRFCVTFKITNKSEFGNNNSFFPLLLTESSPSLPNNHPWRLNTVTGTSANICQAIDLVGVMVTSDLVRFISRSSSDPQNFSYSDFSVPYSLNYNEDTWVRLSYVTETSARLEVSNDINFNSILRSQVFNMPDIDLLNYIFISNCNGNWSTNSNYDLDDYFISYTNNCEVLDLSDNQLNTESIDFEVYPNPNNGSFKLVISNLDKKAKLIICDNLGRLINETYLEANSNVEENFELQSGTYILTLDDGLNKISKKIIVL